MLLRQADAVPPRCGEQQRVAVFLEHPARQVPHRGFILREEDGLGAAQRAGRWLRSGDRLARQLDARQVDLERGAPPRLAVHPDVAAALLHDAVHGREAEARTFAEFLGGEERLEQPRLCGPIDADACVGHGEHHVAARLHRPVLPRVRGVEIHAGGLDGESAAPGHGVAGVDHQVHDDLLELPGIGPDGGAGRLGREAQFDVFPDQAA